MAKRAPGAKTKALGAELRALREARGLNQTEVAARLEVSEPTLSRIETGRRAPDLEEVATLLAIFEVTGQRKDELLDMARTSNGPSWLQAMAPRLPNDSVTLATLEHDATSVTDWALMLVPGLLQTMEYSEAVMRHVGVPDNEIGDRVIARKRRQERLREVDYTAFLHEAALTVSFSDDRVMANQLRHLVDLIQEGVAVRIVPADAPVHVGLVGSFMLLGFLDRMPTVHVELAQSDAFLSGPDEVAYYASIVERLSDLALDTSHSVRLIQQIAEKR